MGTNAEYEEFSAIDELLQRVRQRWRSVNITSGALLYASVVLVAALSAVGTECAVIDSPPWLRRALAIGVAGVAVLGVAYFVLWRMLQDRSNEEFALLVETRFPEIDNGLINAVRLVGEERVTSAQLVAAGMREALDRVGPANVARAVDARRVKRYGVTTGVLAAAAIVLSVLVPGRVANAVQRLLRPHANLAKVGDVRIVKVEPGDRTGRKALVSGETLTVVVTIESRGLQEVDGSIAYREKGEDDVKEQRLRMLSNTSFKAEIRDVKTPLEYQARAGGSASPFFKVEVVEPPTVTGLEVDYQYPPYTGLEPKLVKDSDGAIRGVVGTFFGLRVNSNRMLKKAWLRVDHEEDMALSPDVSKKGAYLPKRLKIEKDRVYTAHIVDDRGYENREPVQRTIRAMPDAKPVVKIAQPGKDEAVAPGGQLAIVARVTDDFGISKATLAGRLRRRNQESKDFAIHKWPKVPQGKKIILSWDWVFDKKTFQSGDIVRYYIVVEDNNNVSGPGVGKSSEYEVRVRDPKKVKQDKIEKYSNWQAELERVLNEQVELRNGTTKLEKLVGRKTPPKKKVEPKKEGKKP